MKSLSLYAAFIRIKIISMIEYPGAFWSHTIAKMMMWGSNLISIYLMIYRFESVFSWSAYEVLLLYSINSTAYALAGFFIFHPFERLTEHIRTGTFDEILTKPVNPFLYLCFKEFSTGYIGNILVTGTGIAICVVKLNIQISLYHFLFTFVMLISGALIHAAFMILFNIPAFWIIKTDALSTFRWSLNEFIQYPLSIYDRWIQVMLTIFFPVAFISFFPAQVLLNKADFLGFSPLLVYGSPIVGCALFAISYFCFCVGVKNYNSTGS